MMPPIAHSIDIVAKSGQTSRCAATADHAAEHGRRVDPQPDAETSLSRAQREPRGRTIPTVPAALVDAMLRDQIAPLTADLLGPGVGQGYGASVLRDPAAAGSTLGRGAIRWGGAYGHSWFIDPATRTAAVLLTNTAFEGMSGALRGEFEAAVCA